MMNIINKSISLLIKPQFIVLVLTALASLSWLIGVTYSPSVAATTETYIPTSPFAPTDMLPPETGLELALKPLTFTVDCSLKPCLALTFDDGPNPKTTPQVLEAFEKTDARATFFVVGNRIAGNEALLRRMQADGFEIGNHSWSHADFTRLNAEQMREQIEATQNALRTAGVPAAQFMRLPYGHFNALVQKNVSLPVILWNIDPKDWQQTDQAKLIQAVEATARPGGIVVLHDTENVTAAAIPELITVLERHFQLVTLSEMLSLPPGARGETIIY